MRIIFQSKHSHNQSKQPKHHKALSRIERQRSHYSEWEQDLLMWLMKNGGADGAFVCTTQKKLSEELGIARSSLSALLHYTKSVEIQSRSGRNGYTMIRKLMD